VQKLRSAIDPQDARSFTGEVIDSVYALEREAGGAIKLVKTFAEIEDCMAQGILAIVLHFEGAEAIREDLSNLAAYYEQGLRSLGIVWSRPNLFATGVPFAYPSSPDTGPGLTQAGRDLVRACNRMGILIDLAHINEKGFWDVAEESSAPLVVSHTDVHAICPSTRNVTDAQIDAVGKTGGIIGLNFEPIQISADANPDENIPLSQLVKHVDYIVNRIGIDHVGFGSDFDGTNMPAELGDAAGLQKLVQALRTGGYDEQAVEKIAYRNWLRVLKSTWEATS
jgi:membrane dipeptidase